MRRRLHRAADVPGARGPSRDRGNSRGVDEEKISVEADFFGLGGNSLQSIRLVSRLNREFGANLSIATLFKSPSIAGLATHVRAADQAEQSIPKYRPTDPTRQALSYSQERLLVRRSIRARDQRLQYRSHLRAGRRLDLSALERSLRAIYARHESLRTLVRYGGAGGYQLVLDAESHPLAIDEYALRDERHFNEILANDIEEVFDLANEIPFRVRLYHLNGTTYLRFLIHHIAFDGWSVEVLLSELEQLYRFHSNSAPSASLPELSIQYRDFAAWERGRFSGEVAARAVAYWMGRLKGHPPLNLPTDRARPPTTSYAGDDVTFGFDEATTSALRQLAAELKVSFFGVLLSGYYLLLRTFTHQDDLIVGVPIATRSRGQLEPLIGCFLNTLALDFHVDGGERIAELILRVAARVTEGQQHQELPFERLVAELGLAVDPSRHPVFQVTFDVNSFVKSHFGGARDRLLRYFRPESASKSRPSST